MTQESAFLTSHTDGFLNEAASSPMPSSEGDFNGGDRSDQEDTHVAPENSGQTDSDQTNTDQALDAHILLKSRDEELAKVHHDLLVALADLENFRKRALREQEEARKYAISQFARDVLAIGDNLDRALLALPRDGDDPRIQTVVEGVSYVAQEFHGLLARHNIQKIPALSAPFDPHLHQAMIEVETADSPPGTVVQVVQEGYQLAGRLLRPTLVGIAKAPAGTGTDVLPSPHSPSPHSSSVS